MPRHFKICSLIMFKNVVIKEIKIKIRYSKRGIMLGMQIPYRILGF